MARRLLTAYFDWTNFSFDVLWSLKYAELLKKITAADLCTLALSMSSYLFITLLFGLS
jgi:hypothetical protein